MAEPNVWTGVHVEYVPIRERLVERARGFVDWLERIGADGESAYQGMGQIVDAILDELTLQGVELPPELTSEK